MQCSVYKNPGDSQSYAPYLLDVQADMLNSLETRVMVPLVRIAEFGRRAGRLHPMFTVCGEEFVMATHLLAQSGSSASGAPWSRSLRIEPRSSARSTCFWSACERSLVLAAGAFRKRRTPY